MAIQRPMCQFRGVVPHAAKPAYILVWKLPSGDVTRFSCADHRFAFGGKGYLVNKVEGFLQDTDTSEDRTQGESAVPDAPIGGQPDSDGKPLGEATCVDPECDECQSRWEDERCGKAAAATATVRPQNSQTSTAPTEDICIRCCKAPALPYPLGCGGQLCQRCVDLQNTEYRQWVAEQRALGNIPFGNGEPETRLVR